MVPILIQNCSDFYGQYPQSLPINKPIPQKGGLKSHSLIQNPISTTIMR